jgi:hypothetical protein
MSEKKSMGWRMLIVFSLVFVVVYAIVVQEAWLQATISRERQTNIAVLGEDRAIGAERNATGIYNALFVRTGMVKKSFDLFVPSDAQRAASQGLETLGEKVFLFVDTRLRAMWTMIYQVIVRLCVAATWWPFVVLALIPCMVDALVSRQIKASSFALTSPHFQGIAVRAVPVLAILLALAMISPLLLHPIWTPVVVSIVAGLAWVAISQFVKRG